MIYDSNLPQTVDYYTTALELLLHLNICFLLTDSTAAAATNNDIDEDGSAMHWLAIIDVDH